MTVSINYNLWGAVEDVKVDPGQEQEVEQALRLLEEGDVNSEKSGDRLVLHRNGEVVSLAVHVTLGGNQLNVACNLEALGLLMPDLAMPVHKHYPMGELQIVRRNLLLPDDRRIRLVLPTESGHHYPPLLDHRVMISSAEPDSPDSPHWNWVRERSKQGGEWYWNPSHGQLTGGLLHETREALMGRVSIFQFNEEERAAWIRHYGQLPVADWRVTTLGARGASIETLRRDVPHLIPVLMPGGVESLMGDRFYPDPVGCGDAYLAALIAAKEIFPDIDVDSAGRFASWVAGLQYSHRGSNLAAVLDHLLARQGDFQYDFGRGLSCRTVA